MRNLDSISQNFDKKLQNPKNWPPVNTNTFSDSKRKLFNSRKRALDLILTSSLTRAEIANRTGISISGLKNLVKRAYIPQEDGTPAGYLACIPHYRLKEYTLTKPSSSGKAGRFSKFLSDYPEIHEALLSWALGKKKIAGMPARGKGIDQIWREFRSLCLSTGLSTFDYPLCNADGGREAVRKFCRKSRESNFVLGARTDFGNHAGRLAAQGTESPETASVSATHPYERIQLDGHKLDILLTVLIVDELGDSIRLPLSRVWLIVAIDCASRAVLGYSLSLKENYSGDDVLDCIACAIEPWSKKSLNDALDLYLPGAGLPSGLISECTWRIFDAVQFDNAFAHTSQHVQERLISAGVHEVQTNRPASPRSNAIVERFNKTFEEMSLHRMPMTTGSSISDPRRNSPEKSANRYEIELNDLKLIVDTCISNYNVTPHESLRGRTPIEYIQQQLFSGRSIPRFTSEKSLEGLKLYERDFAVTIRANTQQGHRAFVKFKNARYSSECLSRESELSGSKAFLRVNTQDIRTGTLFLESGKCIGVLQVEPSWRNISHSLSIRKAITKLIRQKKLKIGQGFPVTEYITYLEKRSGKSKKSRNKLLEVQSHVNSNTSSHGNNVYPIHSTKANKSQVRKSSRRDWISITTPNNKRNK